MATPARHLEPTPAMRMKLLATGGAVLAGILAFERWVAPAIRWVASLPACEALNWVRLEFAVVLALLLGMGLATALKARRVWQLQQAPLPDAWVWLRTEVRTGWRARAHAVLLFATAALLAFGPLYVIVRHELYLVYAFWLPCTEAINCLASAAN